MKNRKQTFGGKNVKLSNSKQLAEESGREGTEGREITHMTEEGPPRASPEGQSTGWGLFCVVATV